MNVYIFNVRRKMIALQATSFEQAKRKMNRIHKGAQLLTILTADQPAVEFYAPQHKAIAA